MERYNLLVTFHPYEAGLAEKEVRKRVQEAGGEVDDIERSSINGVFCVKVAGDAKQLVRSLREEMRDAPEMFAHTFHWVPIDRWVQADDEVMLEEVQRAAEGIGSDESWMMHVHKRHHPKHSEELMLFLTEPIRKGRVDLKNPEKIIAVEVLGSVAGISLLSGEELINANKMRQQIELTREA